VRPKSIDHEEALWRFEEHLGQQVQCAPSVENAGGGGGRPRSRVRVLAIHGVLTRLVGLDDPPEAPDVFRGTYRIGEQLIALPPMAGEVR
jgi:hypothetical protein